MQTIRYMKSIGVSTAVMLIGGYASSVAGSQEVLGEPVALGNGMVQSFVQFNEQNVPTTIGVYFSRESLAGLPNHGMPTEAMLKLPQGAAVPPYNHIGIDWNPQGHEPDGIYDVAHFDVHFYFIPVAERDRIGPDANEQFAKAPPSEALPVNYQQAPGGVPIMGAHWADVTSPEFAGVPFAATFIYGTYDGDVTFYEPMVAKSFLENSPDFIADVKQPSHYSREGYYPTKYRVSYDKGMDKYLVTLSDLKFHKQ